MFNLPILHRICQFECILFREHCGCWPLLLCSLHSLRLFFLMWFITVHSAGYIAPCPADRQFNWVILHQFCQGNKTFALELWTYTPRWPPGDTVRLLKVTAEHLWAHGGCSAVKWRKTSHGRESFILIKRTIKLMRLQSFELDRGRNAKRQREERWAADRAEGNAS